MKYVFLFLPAIGWGLMPLFVAGVKKSSIYNQIVGSVLGAFIFAAIVTAILRPAFDATTFLLAMLAGALLVNMWGMPILVCLRQCRFQQGCS